MRTAVMRAALLRPRQLASSLHSRCTLSTSTRAASHSTLREHMPAKAETLEESSESWGSNVRGLGHNNYLGKILNARVYEVANETPLQPAPLLSAQ